MLLTYGQGSPYADAFDIDWAAGGGRLRIPVVGDEDQESRGGPIANLTVEGGLLRYHDVAFPLAPGSADDIGEPGVDADVVHARQHYELVGWRWPTPASTTAASSPSTPSPAVRVEDPEWFAKTHAAIEQWFGDGQVRGCGSTTPMGCATPGATSTTSPGSPAAPMSWWRRSSTPAKGSARAGRRPGPPATTSSPCSTGSSPTRGASSRWRPSTPACAAGRSTGPTWCTTTSALVADTILRAEVLRIGREIRVDVNDAPADTEDAVAELLACFPVYRSYLPDGREHLECAFAESRHPSARPGGDARCPRARAGSTRRSIRRCASSRPAAW